MAVKDILRRVRLVFDKSSGKQMEGEAKKALTGVERGMAMVKKAALALGAAMGAAFAIKKIKDFAAASVAAARESEDIWNRLGHAVESVGVSFSDARPEIEAFARAMQDVTTVGDEDFAAILTELITTSGDYAASIQAVGTVADLAAAKQLDLRTAAQLVGRALIGETGTFKRYGIVIREGETAMEALRRTFGGFAANEAKTLGGRITQLKNEFSDFKQAVGEMLITAGGGAEIFDSLSGSIKVLSQWVTENRDTFEQLGEAIKALGNPLIGLVRIYAAITRGASMAANAQLKFLEITHTATDSIRQRTAALESYADSLDRLVASMEDEQRRRELGIYLPPPAITHSGNGPPAPSEDAGAGAGSETIDKEAELMRLWKEYGAAMASAQEHSDFLERQAAGWARLNAPMEMSAANAEKLAEMLGKVSEEARISQTEIIAMNAAADLAGSLVAAVFGSDIGKLAAQKAQQNAIMAAEQLAMAAAVAWIPGFQGEAAGHIQAAAMFGSVAAAWGALAGATGGFSGGGGGGRGGPRDVGGAASERSSPPGPEVHIYLEGDFDALNPRVQRVVAGAIRYSGETYGPNAVTTLHRRKGGR